MGAKRCPFFHRKALFVSLGKGSVEYSFNFLLDREPPMIILASTLYLYKRRAVKEKVYNIMRKN